MDYRIGRVVHCFNLHVLGAILGGAGVVDEAETVYGRI